MKANKINKLKKIFVIGCGSISKRHMENLIKIGQKNIIAFDPREDRREEARKLNVETVDSVKAGYDLKPDVVLVMTPTIFHLKDCLEAARRSCDIFVEKPVSHTTKGLNELTRLIKSKRLVFFGGCNLRFHPCLQKVKEIIDSGKLGKVQYIRAQSGRYLPDWHPWEDYRKGYSAKKELGGGILLDGIHEIDYISWLNGKILSVSAIVKKISKLEINTEDLVEIIMEFANKSVGSVHLDYLQRVSTRGCQVFFENGTVIWGFADKTVRIYSSKTNSWRTFKEPAGYDYNTCYVDEMKHFIDCVYKRKESSNSIGFSSDIVRVAEKARIAEKRGGIKVK